MALATVTNQDLMSFIPLKNQSDLVTIYNKIPTDLVNFVNQKNIFRQLNFNRTIQVDDESIGNEYNKQWNSFVNHLFQSIKKVFLEQNVTGIDPYELAVDISHRYLKSHPKWARRGQKLSATVEFNKIYTVHDNDIQVARTDVDAKVRIEETCEHNWFRTNVYRVSYNVELKLKALTADGHKVRALCEIINRDGTARAIEYIKSTT